MMKTGSALAIAIAATLGAATAQAASETFNFIGISGGGQSAPFPNYPDPIHGSITFDPAIATTTANYGNYATYGTAITAFSFDFSGLKGHYANALGGGNVTISSSAGFGQFTPSVTQSDGLTGSGPVGYTLESAGLYSYSFSGFPGGVAFPDLGSTAAFNAFNHSFDNTLFFASYGDSANLDGPVTTIYAAISPAPEPAMWSMLLIGTAAVGGAMRLRRGKVAAQA